MLRSKILLFLLTVLSIAIAEPLSTLNQQPSNNTILPFCFTQQSHPGIRPTNTDDCTRALGRLILEPGFAIPLRFSKNPRRLDAVKVPKGWGAGQCVIFVSCVNTLDADIFRYADVARAARDTIRRCVEEDEYGGLEDIGGVGTFYVSVGRPQPRNGRGGLRLE